MSRGLYEECTSPSHRVVHCHSFACSSADQTASSFSLHFLHEHASASDSHFSVPSESDKHLFFLSLLRIIGITGKCMKLHGVRPEFNEHRGANITAEFSHFHSETLLLPLLLFLRVLFIPFRRLRTKNLHLCDHQGVFVDDHLI